LRLEVIEAVLGHTGGSRAGIVGVYQRHSFSDEKRAALDAWARDVEALVAGSPGNVVDPAGTLGAVSNQTSISKSALCFHRCDF
jgi:hypothetical protein